MGSDLFVSPHIEPIEALIADLDFLMRVELDGLLNRLTATGAGGFCHDQKATEPVHLVTHRSGVPGHGERFGCNRQMGTRPGRAVRRSI
jgi:hypothetical protein